MNKRLLLVTTILLLTLPFLNAQKKETLTKIDTAYKYRYLFENAYFEIKLMLEGKKPASYKKAIFLVENAANEGNLNEQWYYKTIDTIEQKCKQMIAEKGLQYKKTASNWAIFGYMKQPIPYNNYQICSYDYNNFLNKGHESTYVYSLLKTKTGTCHSLPMLYLLLAQELKAEAFLVSAPMHLFIKHKDEYGEWWNLELTGGGFSRTSFIVESFKITDRQMASGLYMKPMNTNETLAYLLEDLRNYYEDNTGVYWDDFNLKVAKLGYKYFPMSGHVISLCNISKYRLDKDMDKVGIHDYHKIYPFPNLVKEQEQLTSLKNKVIETGYKPVSEEWYRDMVKQAFESKPTKK